MAESSAGRFLGIAVSTSLFVAAEDTVFVVNCRTSLSCDVADFGKGGCGRREWLRGPKAIAGSHAGKGHVLRRRLRGQQGAAGSGTDAICMGRPEDDAELCTGSVSVNILHERLPWAALRCFSCVYRSALSKFPRYGVASDLFRTAGKTRFRLRLPGLTLAKGCIWACFLLQPLALC